MVTEYRYVNNNIDNGSFRSMDDKYAKYLTMGSCFKKIGMYRLFRRVNYYLVDETDSENVQVSMYPQNV